MERASPRLAVRRSSSNLGIASDMHDDRTGAIRLLALRGGAGSHLRIGERAARAKKLVRGIVQNPHLTEQIVSIGLRGASAAGKFALSLYLLAYVGLSELGIYGLLVAAATAVPALLGFGLSDWTTRHCIGLPTKEAVSLAGTRLGFTVAVHSIVQPVFWFANFYFGEPIPSHFAILVALILLLEHLGFDANGVMIARQRVMLSSIAIFLRSGAWPFAIIGIGWIYPPARSLAWVLAAWLTGLIVMMLIISSVALGGRWRFLRVRADWLRDAMRRSWPFYFSDIGAVSSLYADRFIISYFAGLELTGIYVFFWSAANVVHSVTVYGAFHPRVPALVAAANAGDMATLRKRLLQFQGAVLVWALLLSGLLWIGVQLFLQTGVRPQLSGHLMLFALVIFAALLRIMADTYHFVLYALCRDRTIALVNLAVAVGSAVLNALLVSTTGLIGAGVASIVTAIGLLTLRRMLSQT
jgi:O-antigen/teichoic acid export membrane protein